MKRGISDNDVYHHMENYSFETPIKVSCIIEEYDSDKTDTTDNSQPPRKSVQYAENQNKNNSATQLSTMEATNHYCCNNVSFNEKRFNEQERRNHKNRIPQHTSNAQNQHTSYEMGNYNKEENHLPLEEMCNITSKMPNTNHLTLDERTQYNNLLDTVSENLIIITKYYHYNNFNYVRNHSAREQYLEYKRIRFKQCYSVVVSIFLPQEHNQAFIRNFINRTIELARRQSWFHHMSVGTLEAIISSMIQWTKQRKKYLEAHDNLLHQMSRPPSVPSTLSVPLVPPVPPSSNSNINFNTPVPTRRPSTYVVPPAQPMPPSSNSNFNCNFNAKHSVVRPPPVPIFSPTFPVPPVPLSSNNNFNYNAFEPMRRPPLVPVVPPALPVTLVPPFSTPEQMSRPPPPLEPPVLSVPTSSNSNFYCNVRQSTSIPPPVSLGLTTLPVPPVPPPVSTNSNFYCNVRQLTSKPPPVSLAPTTIPVPPIPPSSNSNFYCNSVRPVPSPSNSGVSDVNTGQQINRTPQVSRVPPTSKSISNICSIGETISTVVPRLISHQNTPIPAVVHNNICLFSTGPPGNEISISIDPTVAKTVIADRVRKVQHKQNKAKKISKKIDGTSNPTSVSTNSTSNPSAHQHQNHPPHVHNNHNPNHPPRTSNADGTNTSVPPVNNSNPFWPGARQNDNNEVKPSLSRVSRSVSRDSGFGSPVLCSLLINDSNTAYPHSTDNQELTPEITHVTSLHPDALYLASGTCKICGTTTKNVCIVCYNVYYCSTVCQTLDWPIHQKECRAR